MQFSEDQLKLQFQGFLETPPLWRSREDFGIEQFIPSPLPILPDDFREQVSIPDNLVLGRRMEFFLDYYFRKSEEELLGKNLVVYSGKRTLGELDFLLRNRRTGRLSHLELVYKFYLYDPKLDEEANRWIGPNRADTLTKKLQKLKEHQLPLLFREETQELLDLFDAAPKDFEQKVCFKANLFVPQNLLHSDIPLVNKDCIQGVWLKAADFNEKTFGKNSFHIPREWDWPIDPSFCREWAPFDKIFEELSSLHQIKRSPLIWMKNTSNEFSRFFVVWW